MATIREDLHKVHFWNSDPAIFATAPGKLTVRADVKDFDGTKYLGKIQYSIETRIVTEIPFNSEPVRFSTGRYRGTMFLSEVIPESPSINGRMSWTGTGVLEGFDTARLKKELQP